MRVARATVHAQRTLLAGFTTARDLGTEGAGYADVGLKQAIDRRHYSRARGCWWPRAPWWLPAATAPAWPPWTTCPRAPRKPTAWTASCRAVREQIGRGRRRGEGVRRLPLGPGGTAAPTFSLEELALIVQTARSAGRGVVAHASTRRGHAPRRAGRRRNHRARRRRHARSVPA
ncbi:MAG: hypothetical protein WKG07_29465 [Hymenobacter sp.]